MNFRQFNMTDTPQQVGLFDTLQHGQQIPAGGGYSKTVLAHTYDDIISVENLLAAWKEFLRGKCDRDDVQIFKKRLMSNVLALHRDLVGGNCKHLKYEAFRVADPKPRDIHKASVRDRLLHRAIYRKVYSFLDATFIPDSYSCRTGKGMHKAMNQFRDFGRKESHNHTRTCWVLKCDIRKFFASIDQQILLEIVEQHIAEKNIRALITEVVGSFSTASGKGLPLGNLTSQLLANVYMNELDQFMKHKIKAKYYIRYADDFVILSRDRKWLETILPQVGDFLWSELRLTLHPDKVSIDTFAAGVDFLGWVHFPDYRVLRTSTKRRMLRRTMGLEKDDPTVQSYLGMISHGNTRKLSDMVEKRLAR